MTGGEVLIQIESPTGEPLNITSTGSDVKAGTYAKIMRAIELHKQVVLTGCVINNYKCSPIYVNAITSGYAGGVKKYIVYLQHQKSSDGGTETTYLAIFENDKVSVSPNIT